MSAFVVGKSHIDAILRTALDGPDDRGPKYPGDGWHRTYWYHNGPHQLDHETVERVGAMLTVENVRSVQYRYEDSSMDTLPGPIANGWLTDALLGKYDWPAYGTGPVRIGTGPRQLTTVAALKALDCYEYQSCEHPGWEASEAKAFCDSLRSSLIGALPGYEEAEWEVATA
jgi:hypothetical protein